MRRVQVVDSMEQHVQRPRGRKVSKVLDETSVVLYFWGIERKGQ
jgi:hypothetical protein